MGGGLLPHTFPQLLGAASVFLANLSECKPLIHSMFAKACRHLWRVSHHQKDARSFQTSYRSARVRVAIRHSSHYLCRRFRLGCQHRSRWTGCGWILCQHHAQYCGSVRSIIPGKLNERARIKTWLTVRLPLEQEMPLECSEYLLVSSQRLRPSALPKSRWANSACWSWLVEASVSQLVDEYRQCSCPRRSLLCTALSVWLLS
jgi:hypothetical protein